MKILIAEDDATSRLVLQRTVEKMGHQCLASADGLEAWDLFQSADPDVIISDWMMPGLDGVELCQRVRLSEHAYTYFIFATALSDKEHIVQGMRAGADDYLVKPFDWADLEVRLIAAERVTRLHRELMRQQEELRYLNTQLYEQARRDYVTQISNRLQLREDLEQLQARAERYGHVYSAGLCDIDRFKLYNDYYGHLAGDEVLHLVAQTLADQCRSGDVVYRYGGEEFLVILPEQSLEASAVALHRMCVAVEALQIPHRFHKPYGVVTISAGVSQLRGGQDQDLHLLLKESDEALYLAKRAGRNCVVKYEQEGARERVLI